MAASREQIIEAITVLDEAQDAGLTKKPSVKDVEDILGSDVSAAERDEAWEAWEAEKSAPSEDTAPDTDEPEEPAGNEPAMVTNLHGSPISLFGVELKPGQSKPVPGFNAKHAVMKAWLKAGVISLD